MLNQTDFLIIKPVLCTLLGNALRETGWYILYYIIYRYTNYKHKFRVHIYIPALLTEIKLDIVENVKKCKTSVAAIRDLQDEF